MAWAIEGEMVVNCNCAVFCPCVISLGRHPPTEGYCQAWFGLHIDKGHFEDCDLSGLNLGLLLDIPGLMHRGNYTLAGYVDERADDDAFAAIERLFTGQAGGPLVVFDLLVSTHLGFKRAPVDYVADGTARRIQVGQHIWGDVEPIDGKDPGRPVVITNSEYWPGPDITVAQAKRGRVRAFGRIWNFDGRSAEIMPISWQG